MEITTAAQLIEHLQWAKTIEHATIPMYLSAQFSLRDQTSAAADTLRQIAVEEMGHLHIVCNILNALGATVTFDDPAVVPSYPAPLPHHEPDPPLVVHLGALTADRINDVFLQLERPETAGDPPQDDSYATLGQFYAAVEQGITTLGDAVFTGNPGWQVPDPDQPDVTDAKTALAGLRTIVVQGEGTPTSEYSEGTELAHYWRLNQLLDSEPDFAAITYPVVDDPSTTSLPDGPERALSQLFDDCYGLTLRALTHTFGGNPSDYTFITLMTGVLNPLGTFLATVPMPGDPTHTVGASFGFSTTPQSQVVTTANNLAKTYPAIAGVATTLSALPVVPVAVPA